MFGPAALRSLAWGRSYERGEGYAADGRVKRLKIGDTELSATVRGAEAYRVRLWLEDGAVGFSCTCPVAADGLFCKHCVAAGLAAFDADLGGAAAGAYAAHAAHAALRAYLEGLDTVRLTDLLLEQAADDELLRARLELEAAASRAPAAPGAASGAAAGGTGGTGGMAGAAGAAAGSAAADTATYRRVIRDVICPSGFIGYRSMYQYTRGIDQLIDTLGGMLGDGFAADLVELVEHALACLEDALGSVDDSSGRMGDLRDRLVDLHHEVCARAQPDPVALAGRLLEWELHSDWEIFLGAAATYADVLGEAGLAAYRRMAEETWAQLPALAPGEKEDYSTQRFRITFVMRSLAELDGDVDGLIAVKERDLTLPYNFMEIAQICATAGRHDDALAWAERGLAAFPDCTDTRLLDVLADEYEEHGRAEDAVLVMWSLLDRLPRLESYKALKRRATRARVWGAWRARALDRLREQRATPMSRLWGPADRSEVVGALLWERDADAAWDEAVAGGCSATLWMTLAKSRAVDHPEDALPIYERQVERSIAEKNARGYADAVAGLRAVKELLARLGRSDEFPARVTAVRTTHKQKRSLMKLLDAEGW